MSKKQILVSLAGFLVFAGLGFGISYKLSSTTEVPTSGSAATEGSKDNPHQLALSKADKDPVDLLIKKGDYVQFNSKDGSQHQIIQGASTMAEHGPTEHVPSPLDSGVFNGDEGYLLQFKEIGKYEFHDNYDHDHTITIVVYEPGSRPADIKL